MIPEPLYRQVKRHILERIAARALIEGAQVPSENELTRELGISRMTAHRALRELTAEGVLRRVRGAGTFVAAAKPESALFEVRNIAEEIAARGGRHSAEVLQLNAERVMALKETGGHITERCEPKKGPGCLHAGGEGV